jgi:hypothetical protein
MRTGEAPVSGCESGNKRKASMFVVAGLKAVREQWHAKGNCV